MCHGTLATFDNGHAPFARRMAANGRVDGARWRIQVSGDHGMVNLRDGAFLEGPFHHRICQFGFGDHHGARCTHVKAVHDSLAFGRA